MPDLSIRNTCMSCKGVCKFCDKRGTCTSCWSTFRDSTNDCSCFVDGCNQCETGLCTKCVSNRILYSDYNSPTVSCRIRDTLNELCQVGYIKILDPPQTGGYRCDEIPCSNSNCLLCPNNLETCTQCLDGFYLIDWSSQPGNIQ